MSLAVYEGPRLGRPEAGRAWPLHPPSWFGMGPSGLSASWSDAVDAVEPSGFVAETLSSQKVGT